MNELLMIWGADRATVDALAIVRAAGRDFRVVRRDKFALASAEDASGAAAIDSHDKTYCIVIEIQSA